MAKVSLTSYSPLGKLSPGAFQIDEVFQKMWQEAENNRVKWGCKWLDVVELRLIQGMCFTDMSVVQIWGGQPPWWIIRTARGPLRSGCPTGKISKACKNFRLQLRIVWAKITTTRRNIPTWGLCTRRSMHPRVAGRPYMMISPLGDWVRAPRSHIWFDCC